MQPLPPRAALPPEAMLARARAMREELQQRRTVRHFSDRPVAREVIEEAIRAAGTAPSGANRQPWHFVAISDPRIKRAIRVAAEHEEKALYEGRISEEWREALAPLGTDWHKPYLEIVPWIVVVFEQTHSLAPDGTPRKNYYVKESVGIACGLFITALHTMGLATLTHTPSPMNFLKELLRRPDNERPFLLIPMGFPAEGCFVPDLRRKSLDQVMVVHK